MTSQVYFAQNEVGPIKIGFSENVSRRMVTLQSESNCKVRLLTAVAGDRKTEAYFHIRLAPHRLQGEWFSPSHDVLACIKDVEDRGLCCVPADFHPGDAQTAYEFKNDEEVINSVCQFIRALVDPRPIDETIGESLARVVSTYSLPPRTVKSIWYGETVTVSAKLYLTLKEAFDLRMLERFQFSIHKLELARRRDNGDAP